MKRSRRQKILLRKRRSKESRFKHIMGLLHLWFGLLSGIVIIVVCLSGCIYAFKNQFTDLLNQDKVFLNVSGTAKSADEIQEMLAKENKILTSIVIPEQSGRSYVIAYTENGLNNAGYFNQFTGKELGIADVSMNRFFEIILDIHKNLAMGNV